ncbi:MAG: Gfo/Idh/MocA family oxidoreductase [Planctomycetes bacterium]|nr:Gfo/Idh/MocA family oxidoreductase [Planctomycetota bacterium]
MADLGVGIIGAGGIAALSHLPEIAEVDGLKVVNMAGRKETRLKLLQERFDVPRYVTNWEDLLEDPEVDAVVIGLPHPLHAEAALKVLAAGKHLLMTKPLCATMDEANALVEACEAHPELSVFIRPDFTAADHVMRAATAAGDIGKITGGHCRYSHGGPEVYYAGVAEFFGEKFDKDDLWFFKSSEASVGALFDMGVYCISKITAQMGRAVRVHARLATIDKKTELEDTATILIEFENGALGTAETSWCDPARTGFMHIHGNAGKLFAPGSTGSAVDIITPTSYTDENAAPKTEALNIGESENQHAEWLRCIQGKSQPEISNIWFSRHVTEIMLASLESHKTGSWIDVQTSPSCK